MDKKNSLHLIRFYSPFRCDCSKIF